MVSNKFYSVKTYARENKNDLFIAVSFVLIAIIGFGLGRLSMMLEVKPEIVVGVTPEDSIKSIEGNSALIYVASKNGSVYYLPACGGVSRIKDENKIWFSSGDEAERLGYRPAKNCPGL